MYDTISADYDRFVDWQGRLAIELPFIITRLHEVGARTILDIATGTGMHAIALAQCGFTTTGADVSLGMVERARANANSAKVGVRFVNAGFGSLSERFGEHSFDALLCLGNSLPHLLSPAELNATITDFASVLQPGGLLLVQNRNFDAIMAKKDRWMEPQSHTEDDNEWLFQRFYDFDPDGLITFNMVTLKRSGGGDWSQSVTSSRIRPLFKDEVITDLESAGFTGITTFGSMAGTTFDPHTSPNLVIVARSV